MRTALVISFLLAPALAAADPSFEVVDRGTSVEVIAHDVTAAKTSISPIRSRLEIPLVGHPRAPKVVPIDGTVKQIELDGDTQRVFSVKTGFEHADVVRLAKFAQAMQVGPDVHIIFPRTVPAEGAAIVLPEPTLPPALAAKVAAAKGTIAPAAPTAPAVAAPAPATPAGGFVVPNLAAEAAAAKAKTAAPVVAQPEPVKPEPVKPEPVKPEPALAATTEAPAAKTEEPAKPEVAASTEEAPKPEPKHEPAKAEAKPEKKPAAMAAAKSNDDPWQKLSMYGAIGLAAIGAGVWMLRKRKANGLPMSTIDVIAQKSLGGKAKVVWFTAGGREMVVAVTPQAVRMLGQWKKSPSNTEASTMQPLPRAHTHADDKPASSPAVNGILKLRERASTQTMAAITDDMSEDVDQAWAREILAATGARK